MSETIQGFWGAEIKPTETPINMRMGSLSLWLKTAAEELWVAQEYLAAPAEDSEVKEPPDSLTWSRWALKSSQAMIRLVPVFPDRPVVVKPELSFRLIRGAQARIYVRVPLWVRLELAETPARTLTEIPTAVLSSTWFGAFTDGELCYWICSGARRQYEMNPARHYQAICPLQLTNQAEEELSVEKICLRVAGLSLFIQDGQLWADDSRILYRGGNQVSQVEASGKPPREAPQARLISPPRNPEKKGLAAKTFTSLRELPGLGFLTS